MAGIEGVEKVGNMKAVAWPNRAIRKPDSFKEEIATGRFAIVPVFDNLASFSVKPTNALQHGADLFGGIHLSFLFHGLKSQCLNDFHIFGIFPFLK